MIALVTGYSKSGKTTLPQLFNKTKGWNYSIYSKDTKTQLQIYGKVNEVKIAKIIRRELEIEDNVNNERKYEDMKDKLFMGNYTYRDILEQQILYERKKDPYYFIKKCYAHYIAGNENQNLMITDFRFPEEYDYLTNLNPTTIRIFRKVPEIKSEKYSEYKSEHALDSFKTDFLFIPYNESREGFWNAIAKFPQYSNYTKIY